MRSEVNLPTPPAFYKSTAKINFAVLCSLHAMRPGASVDSSRRIMRPDIAKSAGEDAARLVYD